MGVGLLGVRGRAYILRSVACNDLFTPSPPFTRFATGPLTLSPFFTHTSLPRSLSRYVSMREYPKFLKNLEAQAKRHYKSLEPLL